MRGADGAGRHGTQAAFTLPKPRPCDTVAMRAAIGTIAGAVIFGLAGGYAWSTMAPGAGAPVAAAPAIEAGRGDPAVIERSVHYSGCNAVRAAGKAPLHAGQPGYRSEMDGDGDGIACEPIRGRS